MAFSLALMRTLYQVFNQKFMYLQLVGWRRALHSKFNKKPIVAALNPFSGHRFALVRQTHWEGVHEPHSLSLSPLPYHQGFNAALWPLKTPALTLANTLNFSIPAASPGSAPFALSVARGALNKKSAWAKLLWRSHKDFAPILKNTRASWSTWKGFELDRATRVTALDGTFSSFLFLEQSFDNVELDLAALGAEANPLVPLLANPITDTAEPYALISGLVVRTPARCKPLNSSAGFYVTLAFSFTALL
jgi:hypothetical protein